VVRNVVAAHQHTAEAHRQKSEHRAQERRLAGAIRADHGHHLAGINLHRDAVQDIDLAVTGDDALRLENRARFLLLHG
jgi:hypothetical protein